MQRVDGFYLYTVGAQLRPLKDLKDAAFSPDTATTLGDARYPIYVAEGALEPLLTRSVFHLRTSYHPGSSAFGRRSTAERKNNERP
jgi:hypothetical protein